MRPKGSRNRNGVSRILNVHGYYERFEPHHPLAKKNGYVLEHRMIAYDAGLLTDNKKAVHHKNEIKTDNRLDNLEITGHAEHTSRHWKGAKRRPFSEAHRKSIKQHMKGNKNWQGKRNENPELLGPTAREDGGK